MPPASAHRPAPPGAGLHCPGQWLPTPRRSLPESFSGWSDGSAPCPRGSHSPDPARCAVLPAAAPPYTVPGATSPALRFLPCKRYFKLYRIVFDFARESGNFTGFSCFFAAFHKNRAASCGDTALMLSNQALTAVHRTCCRTVHRPRPVHRTAGRSCVPGQPEPALLPGQRVLPPPAR